MPPEQAIKVFYSYSHRDEPYREKLETCLSTLRREGVIQEWHDRKILPGQSWADEIDGNLESADLVLLLISPDFIASDYCHDIEMKRALQRQADGSADVVALIIKPTDWQRSAFAKLQVLPKNGKPVQKWKPQGDAFLDIAQGIRRLVESRRSADVLPAAMAMASKISTRRGVGKMPALQREYLLRMAQEWRDLPLRALASRACDPTGKTPPLDLEQVYVALDTTTPKPGRDKREELYREQELLTASAALAQAQQGRMVLLGQPGSGKSTFGRYLALMLAEHLLNPDEKPLAERLPGWDGGPLLPVFAPLRRLAARLAGPGAKADLAFFLSDEVESKEGLRGFGPALLEELEQAGGLVVFDGLDEVAAEYREQVKQALAGFAERHPRCRILVTCRVHSYRLGPAWQLGWETHELADFSSKRVESFIQSWFAALARISPAEQATLERKGQTLQDALGPADPRGLRELAGKPLLLTVMAIVHNHKELPGSRVGVYRECVDILLQRWEAHKSEAQGGSPLPTLAACGLTDAAILDALREIAYLAHESGTQGRRELATVEGGLIAKVVAEYGAAAVEPFLAHCRHANGLLLLDAVEVKGHKSLETYRFPHLSFQEYLAALHFNKLDADGEDGIEIAAAQAGDPAWWEVVRFFGEYLCYDETANTKPRELNALLEGLCPSPPAPLPAGERGAKAPPSVGGGVGERADDAAWRRAWLAGLLVPGWESRLKEKNRPAGLRSRIVQRLAQMMESTTALHGEPAARAAAGRALSGLGDPRRGVGVREGLPDILWVPVAGTGPQGCKLGTGAKPDKEAGRDEAWPEGKAPLIIEAFELAAYPVTVAQYECFVRAGGYGNPAYWSKAGWQAVGKNFKEPEYWQDWKWHQANHPVTGVSWFEAEAFGRWLAEKLNRPIRLPTEAEWEWAARGREGRRYPWGDGRDALKANTGDSQLGRSTAVGLYPAGAAQIANGAGRVYDLVGNVFEWTASAYSEGYAQAHRLAQGGAGSRVLRGGSWFHDPRLARASYRRYYVTGSRSRYLGFRLVCAPPIADL